MEKGGQGVASEKKLGVRTHRFLIEEVYQSLTANQHANLCEDINWQDYYP